MLESLVVVTVSLSAVALLLGAVLLFKKYGRSMRYLWAIPVVVLLGFGVWWGISSFGFSTPPTAPSSSGWSLQAPRPSSVWEFFKDYWLWIAVVLVGLYFGSGVVTKPWAKAVQGMVIAVAVVLAGAMIVHGIWGDNPSSRQQQMASKAVMPTSPGKFVLPAKSKSGLVPPDYGMRIMMNSDKKFTNHTVYRDGTDCAFSGVTCPNGDVVGNYAENPSDEEEITVTYYSTPIK